MRPQFLVVAVIAIVTFLHVNYTLHSVFKVSSDQNTFNVSNMKILFVRHLGFFSTFKNSFCSWLINSMTVVKQLRSIISDDYRRCAL